MCALYMKLTEKVLEDLCTITRWLNGPGKDDSIGELKKNEPFPLATGSRLCAQCITCRIEE